MFSEHSEKKKTLDCVQLKCVRKKGFYANIIKFKQTLF